MDNFFFFFVFLILCQNHRIITARKEKGWRRHFFHQIEPNWPLPYSTVPVPRLREARPAGWVTYCSICASTMLRAQNRTGKGSILLWRRFTFPIFQLFIYGYAVGALFFLLLSKTENSEICGYITMTTEEQQEDGKHRKSATINQNKIENIVTPWPRRFEWWKNWGSKITLDWQCHENFDLGPTWIGFTF